MVASLMILLAMNKIIDRTDLTEKRGPLSTLLTAGSMSSL